MTLRRFSLKLINSEAGMLGLSGITKVIYSLENESFPLLNASLAPIYITST